MGDTQTRIRPRINLPEPAPVNSIYTIKQGDGLISALKALKSKIKTDNGGRVPSKLQYLFDKESASLYLHSQFNKDNPGHPIKPGDKLSIDNTGNVNLKQAGTEDKTIIPKPQEVPVLKLPEPAKADSFINYNILDPGHGSHKDHKIWGKIFDSGSIAIHNGLRNDEEEVVERLALDHFKPELDKQFHVVTTRDGDLGVEDIDGRIARINSGIAAAKKEKPELPTTLISVHANWSSKSSDSGMIIFIADADFKNKSSDSYQLASKIAGSMQTQAGLAVKIKSDRDTRHESIGILRRTHADAKILIETGFMTNANDIRMMTEADIEGMADQTELSQALRLGLAEYYKEKQ
ncbi:MAG: N-acetylmuramoyl-L-alanine amidase [Cyanobacteria bacterium]|nr:N-acetylmuramoyl-L-alanine amidase [Cyanobacteriota bacterium]